MAVNLAAANIDSTLIDDAAVFALMARVNKVVISASAILADGSLLAVPGTHLLALSCKSHSVPLIALSGMYKVSMAFSGEDGGGGGGPGEVLPFEEVAELERVHVDNPSFDHIPPSLVSLLLTNYGGYNTSYVYRVLGEYYNSEDAVL
eukprot:TRINITY_DN3387_c0_g1_i1.p2 TRINITY_DN3387_c0_g1~~TRINITY_DN3387_c0_g1_i1.p2  ORF type:complete len:148 (+),score=35.35 TRINITY_DN3387_c0_g1_i1:676-1119(+)